MEIMFTFIRVIARSEATTQSMVHKYEKTGSPRRRWRLAMTAERIVDNH
jgi:hypothetical protein